MHEAAFARAALPKPAIVLGIPLRPFALGHELQLQGDAQGKSETREPKPEGNPKAEIRALIRAVLICAHSWENRIGRQPDWLGGFKMRIWGWRLRGMEFDRELAAFRRYREEGSLEFPLSDIVRPGSGGPSRPPGAPFLLRLHQFLVTKLHCSELQAWDYPLGLAKMQWVSYWEEEGGLQVYNWQDAEHDAFVARMEAEEAALKPESESKPVDGEGGMHA